MGAETHQLALPTFPIQNRSVLDIGCQDGATLMHQAYAGAARRCGIDIDAAAIGLGSRLYPQLELAVGSAEQLPYPDCTFDVVISKVAILYTDLRVSLSEAFRVLRPGGDFFLTTHDWRHLLSHFLGSVRGLALKRCVDQACYVLPASLMYILSGYIPPRPWNGQRETFQSVGSLSRGLRRAGFEPKTFLRTPRDFIIIARRDS